MRLKRYIQFIAVILLMSYVSAESVVQHFDSNEPNRSETSTTEVELPIGLHTGSVHCFCNDSKEWESVENMTLSGEFNEFQPCRPKLPPTLCFLLEKCKYCIHTKETCFPVVGGFDCHNTTKVIRKPVTPSFTVHSVPEIQMVQEEFSEKERLVRREKRDLEECPKIEESNNQCTTEKVPRDKYRMEGETTVKYLSYEEPHAPLRRLLSIKDEKLIDEWLNEKEPIMAAKWIPVVDHTDEWLNEKEPIMAPKWLPVGDHEWVNVKEPIMAPKWLLDDEPIDQWSMEEETSFQGPVEEEPKKIRIKRIKREISDVRPEGKDPSDDYRRIMFKGEKPSEDYERIMFEGKRSIDDYGRIMFKGKRSIDDYGKIMFEGNPRSELKDEELSEERSEDEELSEEYLEEPGEEWLEDEEPGEEQYEDNESSEEWPGEEEVRDQLSLEPSEEGPEEKEANTAWTTEEEPITKWYLYETPEEQPKTSSEEEEPEDMLFKAVQREEQESKGEEFSGAEFKEKRNKSPDELEAEMSRDLEAYCHFPKKGKNFVMQVVRYPTYDVITQKCMYGHTMSDGISREMRCDHETKTLLLVGAEYDYEWRYHIKFEECKPFVNCTPEFLKAGERNCRRGGAHFEPPSCYVHCFTPLEGENPEGTHVCDVDVGWKPPLPSCAVAGSNYGLVQPPKTKRHIIDDDIPIPDDI